MGSVTDFVMDIACPCDSCGLSLCGEADEARRKASIGEGFNPRRMRYAMSENLTPGHVEQSIAALSNHSALPDFFI
jgi:hypothetical protein